MKLRLLKMMLGLSLIMCISSAAAKFTFKDFNNLPELPRNIFDWSLEKRVAWLTAEADATQSSAEKYRLQRQLFYEFYWTDQQKPAQTLCQQNPPLREDYYYRENCTETTSTTFEDYLPQMLEIVHDAKQTKNNDLAAEILANLAWRQSQYGDIAGAYTNYETALDIVPAEDILLFNTIMMDTATNYIIHGDQTYIHKGTDLLEQIREKSSLALLTEKAPEIIETLKDNIVLTSFNTGIAHMLHLYDYQRALEYFDKVNQINSAYSISALSFSALAAAELEDFDRAKSYLQKLAGQQHSQAVVEKYLSCYRQLATHHWDKTQSLSSCLELDPATTMEVKLDVFKRLAEFKDPEISLFGLKKLKVFLLETLEPQLKKRGSQAASNTELRRLQRESELKSLVLEQQKQLQQEKEQAHANQFKFFVALFVVLISFILLVMSQLRQKNKLAEQFQRLSTQDPLTKLGNRRFLEQKIEQELSETNQSIQTNKDAALGIYVFDIDHFKKINDTYGHQVGDQVLIEISHRISRIMRDSDLLVRWGGEEFVFIARLNSDAQTYQLADRILKAFNQELFKIENHAPLKVTCTLGVVKYPFINTGNLTLWSRLISLADAALYYGKAKQRNCWVTIENENINAETQFDELLTMPLQDAINKKLISIKTSIAAE